METSIRFLRIERRAIKPVLCFRGRNQAHAVINDETCIRAISHIPVKDHDDAPIVMGPVGLGRREYPIDLFVKRFEDIGKRKGITLRAQYFLKRALEGGVEDNEPLPPDILPGEASVESKTVRPQSKATPDGFAKLADAIMHPARSPKPDKPKSPPVAPPKAVTGPARTAGADVIRTIAAELQLEPTKLRKLLRAAGLRAPYDDIAKVRAALK